MGANGARGGSMLGLDCIQDVLAQQSSQWMVAQAHWCSRHGNPENKCGDEDAPPATYAERKDLCSEYADLNQLNDCCVSY